MNKILDPRFETAELIKALADFRCQCPDCRLHDYEYYMRVVEMARGMDETTKLRSHAAAKYVHLNEKLGCGHTMKQHTDASIMIDNTKQQGKITVCAAAMLL